MLEPDSAPRELSRLAAAVLGTPSPLSVARRVLDPYLGGLPAGAVRYLVGGVGVITVDRDDAVNVEPVGPNLRYDQTEELFGLVDSVLAGRTPLTEVDASLAAIRRSPPTVAAPGRALGYVLLVVGLVMTFSPSASDLGWAAALAVPAAALIVLVRRSRVRALVPAIVSAGLGIPVLALTGSGALHNPRDVLIPLLATVIPGAVLTLGSLELSEGDTQAGAVRLASGVHQLLLMALGLGLASSVTGVGLDRLVGGSVSIGPWVAPVGVAVYAAGVGLTYSSKLASLPALVVISYVAWATQRLADAALGGLAADFLAALFAVVAADGLFRYLKGPPPVLTFNPVFRIVAPGGLSLLGATAISGGGPSLELGSVVFTFIAVALGIVVGVSIGSALRSRRTRNPRTAPTRPASLPDPDAQ